MVVGAGLVESKLKVNFQLLLLCVCVYVINNLLFYLHYKSSDE